MKKKGKFIVLVTSILAALGYLAVTGFEAGKSYYKTVSELMELGDRAQGVRLRVAGTVVPGTIEKEGFTTRFRLEQAGQVIPVVYLGDEPLPDTFHDEAQAVVDGTYGRDGVFSAKKIQAKCASKYETRYDKNVLEPAGS